MLALHRIYRRESDVNKLRSPSEKRFDGWDFEKQKECNSKKRIVLLHSRECNSIFLLQSWEIELSIRHHVTKINQLHDLNLTRYYIKFNNMYTFIPLQPIPDTRF